MRMLRSLGIVLAALAACLAAPAFAQGGAGRLYNSGTEVTAKGAVDKVTNITTGQGWYGVHLSLKAQDRTYDVRLGPSDFIAQNSFTFASGDQVEVWGSQIESGASNVIVARAIEKDGRTLTLRDADGFPAWAGMGMGGGYRRGCCGGYGCGGGRGYHGCGCGCRGGCGGY